MASDAITHRLYGDAIGCRNRCFRQPDAVTTENQWLLAIHDVLTQLDHAQRICAARSVILNKNAARISLRSYGHGNLGGVGVKRIIEWLAEDAHPRQPFLPNRFDEMGGWSYVGHA